MTILWIVITISQVSVAIVSSIYYEEILKVMSENAVITITYLAIFSAFVYYRRGQRSKFKSQPNFANKLKNDAGFSRAFNNSEIKNMFINYFFVATPLFYASGIVKNTFKYFGYSSGGFAVDLQRLVVTAVVRIFPVVLGLIGTHIYEKYKAKNI